MPQRLSGNIGARTSEDDEDTTTIDKSPTIIGPITRSRAKQISDQVNANLSLPCNLDDTTMLSSPLLLVELRYHMEEIQQPMSSWSNRFGGTSLEKTSFKWSWCCQFLPLMFRGGTPIWWRYGAIGVHQQKLHQIIFPMQKTSHHLELWVKSSSHSRGRCPGCQDFANFRGALQQLPKLTAYSPKEAMQTCLLLKPFSHLAKGRCPCYKTSSPPSSR